MNGDDVERTMVTLLGHWPAPALTRPEQVVWAETLAELDRPDLARSTLKAMALNAARFRPNAGEFLAEYRRALGRQLMLERVDAPAELDGPGMSAVEAIAKSRECLR